MLITCPYCGPRDVIEFTYQGDGNREHAIAERLEPRLAHMSEVSCSRSCCRS